MEKNMTVVEAWCPLMKEFVLVPATDNDKFVKFTDDKLYPVDWVLLTRGDYDKAREIANKELPDVYICSDYHMSWEHDADQAIDPGHHRRAGCGMCQAAYAGKKLLQPIFPPTREELEAAGIEEGDM